MGFWLPDSEECRGPTGCSDVDRLLGGSRVSEISVPAVPPAPPSLEVRCVAPAPYEPTCRVISLASFGALVGKQVVAAKGFTAVGVLAKGAAGFGCAAVIAGPVLGAVGALAIYGLYRALSD